MSQLMKTASIVCPCCSGLEYDRCCKVLHHGQVAKSAEKLMRSRYAAYALGLPDYIIQTTHPASAEYMTKHAVWKQNILQFSQNIQFQRLEILSARENRDIAEVVFTAHLAEDDRDATFTERSYFEKANGRFWYVRGDVEAGRAEHLVSSGQLRVLPLAYYGEAVLRQKAAPITVITDEIKQLVEDMVATMLSADGMGLAAPQVHRSIRLFVIQTPENEAVDPGKIDVFINPVLSFPSSEKKTATEGCVSIPTVRATFDRPTEITVEYTTLDGVVVKKRFSGWMARAVMHENDHLNGMLTVERMPEEAKRKIEPFLRNFEKRMRGFRE